MNEEVKSKYLEYLNKHIEAVKQAYDFLVNKGIVKRTQELDVQIKTHDKSKFDIEEFEAYANKFSGVPNEQVFQLAWQRHQSINPHHWQYWVKEGKAADIPENYIVEMVCDWLAFSISKNNLDEIHEWYQKENKKQKLTDDTRSRVENILGKLKDLLQNQTSENQKTIF